MHDTLPLLSPSTFPAIARQGVETLQINIGLRCNLACLHCHTNSNPYRKEAMSVKTIELVLRYLQDKNIEVLDITGGAPELHPQFKELVTRARALGVRVIDRCNLTVLEEPGYQEIPEFLALNSVEVIASLPCYSEDNVDSQRGKGVYDSSIRVLQKLNDLGYGQADSGLELSLVYNPLGASLPPAQETLEDQYKKELFERHNIVFNRLFTLCNMPIKRFGSTLVSKGEFDNYINLLREAHSEENLPSVMCRSLISVDWQGYVYDCDFNQMLGLEIKNIDNQAMHLSDLLKTDIMGKAISVRNHCYGCTAGQGSSCSGALS